MKQDLEKKLNDFVNKDEQQATTTKVKNKKQIKVVAEKTEIIEVVDKIILVEGKELLFS